MRILGICSYKGTNYHGWQKQVGFVSVQSTIEEALSRVYDTEINIVGSGRTDAGVHALKQYFHFDTEKEKDLTYKNPFQYERAYVYPMEFGLDLFKKALDKFVGKHNFQDFTSKEEDEANFVREVFEINVNESDHVVDVTFIGNGFMRYQIRNMVGAAISVAGQKESLDFIDYHLKEDKEREIISYKAPASGLYLVDVFYK